MSENQFYYVNADTKTVAHFKEKQDPTPQGYTFAGMSQLPIKGAAGYYTKNAEGYSIENGLEQPAEPTTV